MRWLVQAQNAATWVAEDDGALTGFAIVEWTQAIHEISAYIQTIEVLPELRGQGVGGALLKHMEGSALAAGASTIWLHVDVGNFGAICLYETNGFLRSGDEENYYAPGRGAYVYRKQLTEGYLRLIAQAQSARRCLAGSRIEPNLNVSQQSKPA